MTHTTKATTYAARVDSRSWRISQPSTGANALMMKTDVVAIPPMRAFTTPSSTMVPSRR